MPISQELFSLTGEHRVCSELTKRGVFATITPGHRKAVDIYAIGEKRSCALRIEVKTSQKRNFVTKITQKGLHRKDCKGAPDFWVLVRITPQENGRFLDEFFILSHREICRLQRSTNQKYARGYRKRHGKSPNSVRGVDNVVLTEAAADASRDRWDKIIDEANGT
jgi:hypothetical protein